MKIMTRKEQRLDLSIEVDFMIARNTACSGCNLNPPTERSCVDCMWFEYDKDTTYPAVYQVIRIEFRGE